MNRCLLLAIAAAIVAACSSQPPAPPDGPYQTTGIKIVEPTQTSAIIWTRTTASPERVGKEVGIPVIQYKDGRTGELTTEVSAGRRHEAVGPFPDGEEVDRFEGGVPGVAGETRVRYRKQGESEWQETDWGSTDPEADFTRHVKLTGLEAGTRYEIEVEARAPGAEAVGSTLTGGFHTAPAPGDEARVVFTVTTGTAYPDQDAPEGGYKMYAQMLKLDPDFFVHTGDIIYYDKLAKNETLARWHWHRMYSLPTDVAFHRQVASYFIKDDHDVWMNDCWPTMETKYMGDFTFAQGQKIFLEQTGETAPNYRTMRWGKDLQVWFPEGRDFRSPNDMEDGPEKSILGAEQKAWLKRTMEESDATFKVVISATPIVGPDRGNKRDNHANIGFQHEGDELRQFLSGLKNTYVACGDRHWQYVSKDKETGLIEFSSGPASDEHAGGFRMDQRTEEHLYLNIVGGFLAGTVERVDGKPRLVMRHYGVNGDVLNEVVREAE
jgi:alkaline phosphatase D